MRSYGHVLRRDNGDMLRRVFDLEMVGRKGRERPSMTWKMQVEEYTYQIELKRKDATDKTNSSNVVDEFFGNIG